MLIEGEVTYRKWDDNGVTKYATDILGNTFQLVGGIGTNNNARRNDTPKRANTNEDISSDDDLPF